MESILESILYVDHINIILHTFYFCLFVTSCVLPMHSSNERNTSPAGLADFGYIP